MPKVSIGIPVFNGAPHLIKALEAVERQTFQDWEVIVCDNASTDATPEICAAFAAKDERFRFIRNPENIGAAPNFNKVFQKANGTYFAWKAHAHAYAPTWIERCVEILDTRPDVVLAQSRANMLDAEGAPLIFDAKTRAYLDRYGTVIEPEDPPLGCHGSPDKRFMAVLQGARWCLQLFGLMRAEDLRATKLQRSYYGADRVLLAELALMGKCFQIEERLFDKHIRPEPAFFGPIKARRDWIDPEAPRGMPLAYMIRDYGKAIMSTSMAPARRAACFAALLKTFSGREGVWKRLAAPCPDTYLGASFTARRRSHQQF